MHKSKKAVGILVLVMVFMMMFSSVAMAAEEDMLSIKATLFTNNLDMTQETADEIFVIKDNTIIGLTEYGANVEILIIPDTINGQTVNIDYEAYKSYAKSITITSNRRHGDINTINMIEQSSTEEVTVLSEIIGVYSSVIKWLLLIVAGVLILLSIWKAIQCYNFYKGTI